MTDVSSNDDKKKCETDLLKHDVIHHEESVDPRVQVELERLNTATDSINKLEIELDEARANFRLLLSESSVRVNQLASKLGACVEKARPYYEARMQAKQLQSQTQKAALRYERASSAHSAAKEMVYLAEEGLKKEGRCFDPAWQEMLNHATLRVNEAESERVLSQHEHQKTSLAYNESEKVVQHLHQEIRKSIVKSSLSTRRSLLQLNNLANQHQLQLLPYFEMKAQFNQLLEEQRKKVHHLEERILKMKMSYADALHNLEEISDEIHEKRKNELNDVPSVRSKAEGAESFHLSPNSNISLENLNIDDMYMSLPPKLTRPDIIATTCMGSSAQVPPSSSSKLETTTDRSKNSDKSCKKQFKTNISVNAKRSSQVSSNNPVVLLKDEEASGNNQLHDENKFVETDDGSFEEDFPEYKFLMPDLNILRIQREELSDSESLASTDTTDTLDDNQIECLLLEKVLPSDLHESNGEKELKKEPTDSNL